MAGEKYRFGSGVRLFFGSWIRYNKVAGRARQQLYEFEKALGLLDLRRRVEKAARLADALSAHVPEAAQIRELLERKEA